MAKYTEADFHLPRPRPPTRDFRWYSLIVPPVGFSIGMVLFGLLGFSFVELRDMPALLRSNIVVLGSIGLAIGSELGTLPALLEVFRKVGAGKAGVWDWIGLGVSVLTSITILIMSWAWLLQIDVLWSETIRTYGPLVLGSFAILDFTASGIEAGLYLSTYDDRFTRWQTDLNDWLIKMNQLETAPAVTFDDLTPDPEVSGKLIMSDGTPPVWANIPKTDDVPLGWVEHPGPGGTIIGHPISLETPDGITTSSGGPPVWTGSDLEELLKREVSGKPCWCGWQQSGVLGDLTPDSHAAMHRIQAGQFESAGEALDAFKEAYDNQRWTIQGSHSTSLPNYPTVLEITKWREEEE